MKAHRGILIVLGLFVALGVWYSLTTPLFETPDEREHFAFVQFVATKHELPIQSEQPDHLARQEGSQPPLYYLLASALTFWVDTSDFPAIVWENPHYGYTVPGIVNDNKNLFIHTSIENFPYRNAVLAIRLSRWLSVLMGALAVLFTYLLALEIVPNKTFAALAAAMIAFVPQFIFISGAVSNDTTIAAMSALSLWLIARMLTADRRPATAEIILLGFACGLAALAKVSGAGLAVVAVIILGWVTFQHADAQKFYPRSSAFIRVLIIFGATVFVVAGWWYLRNLILYGELTGTEMMTRIFFARVTPMTFDQLLVQLREVWETMWIGFGWGNVRAVPEIYVAIEIFVAIAFIGLVFAIRNSKFLLLVSWVAIVFIALVRWMMVTQAPHGRLMFPALPAIAVLLALGLDRIPNSKMRIRNWSWAHLAFVIFLFALAASAPITLLRPAYAYPQMLRESDIASVPNRVDISYDDKIKLLGYTVSSRTISPGGAIELTLYWQSLAPMDEDYSLGIRVLDANQRVIGTRDSYPGHGMLPTRLWQPSQVMRDVYWLPINSDAPGSADAQIQIVVYNRLDKRDLTARDPRGAIITPFIGQIEVAAK